MKPYRWCLLFALFATTAVAQDLQPIAGGGKGEMAVEEEATNQEAGHVSLPDQQGQASVENENETAVSATLDDSLISTEHWGMRSFSQEVANGKYLVKLYFAETYQQISGPGQRVFSFNVNGVEFQNFDIWERAGGTNRIYVESVPVEIDSGRLQVTFAARVENPAIKAIEIIPQHESAKADGPIRINAGGSAPSIDSVGRSWLPDQGFVGGRVNSGRDQYGYGGSSWTSNQSPRLFMNYDMDGSVGLNETELPQTLRFVHPRLDEDGDEKLSVSEIGLFDAFVLRQSDGEELKNALLDEDVPSAKTIARLQQRLDDFDAEVAGLDANVVSQIDTAKRAEWNSYVFTVSAMLIAAFSFGHLLSANPPRRQRWTQIDASPEALRTVIESLVLIALLSVIDLLWTTFSSTESHFHEMNPVGNHLLVKGGSLATFKVISLAGAIALLFFLRKFKGAQLASWWACVICTLVTFRWIVLDSAMLG